jgi:hypothetical protein
MPASVLTWPGRLDAQFADDRTRRGHRWRRRNAADDLAAGAALDLSDLAFVAALDRQTVFKPLTAASGAALVPRALALDVPDDQVVLLRAELGEESSLQLEVARVDRPVKRFEAFSQRVHLGLSGKRALAYAESYDNCQTFEMREAARRRPLTS